MLWPEKLGKESQTTQWKMSVSCLLSWESTLLKTVKSQIFGLSIFIPAASLVNNTVSILKKHVLNINGDIYHVQRYAC